MTGRPGKWPWKNHSVAVTPLIPTIRFASASYSTIRSTSRNGQRCGISASISRVVWMGSVTGDSRSVRRSVWPRRRRRPSGTVCAGLHAQAPAHDRAAAARNAALPTRSSRFVVIRPSRNVSFASSAWWIATFVTRPSTTQLVERDPAAGDRRRAVRAPDDQLAEQRVVVRRDLVARVQVRVHPDARAARRVVALDDAGAGPEVVRRDPRR